jgi:diacylglycerol kinase (ATP)
MSEQLPPPRTGLSRIVHAGLYSLAGLTHAVKNEAAFRQEACLACILIPAAVLIPVEPMLRLLLVLAMLAVLVTELLNSAVEAVVDHVSPQFHPLAKQAKDMGSAAVLLSLLGLLATWGLALYQLLSAGC